MKTDTMYALYKFINNDTFNKIEFYCFIIVIEETKMHMQIVYQMKRILTF